MQKLLNKIGRTLLISMPSRKDELYSLKRFFRAILRLPVDSDFQALRLFPDSGENLFLDIGGNHGAAVDTLLMLNKNCEVYSFEPNPEVHMRTRSRFKTNDRVKMFNFGLGNTPGDFTLYIPVYRGYKFDGWASFSPDFDDAWLSKSIFFYNRKFLSLLEVTCTIKRMDDLDLSPFFIKIDVEGLELEVLCGALETIDRCRPIILLETGEKHWEIAELLKPFGYKIYRYSVAGFVAGKRGRRNSYFMTDEALRLITSNSSPGPRQ